MSAKRIAIVGTGTTLTTAYLDAREENCGPVVSGRGAPGVHELIEGLLQAASRCMPVRLT